MEQHVKLVGILNMVFWGMGLLAALVVLFVFGGLAGMAGASREPDAAQAVPILGAIGVFVFVVLMILALPGFLGGWGVLQYKEWGRILTIIVSIINLFGFPLGTALGIYSLWTLFSNETVRLFQARRAA